MQFPKLASFRGHHFLSRLIKKDSIVIDLGAHLGEFSREITDRFGCQSYAVEALPSLFEVIKENNLITKFNYAVTEANEPIAFNISANPEGNSINLSMAEATSKMNATNTIFSYPEQKTVSVNGITLETFLLKHQIPKIDLLKIDIEGAEIELFKSTSDAVITKIKQITIEFHDFLPEFTDIYGEQVREIKQRLKSLGFFCIVFSPNYNMDVLMVNTKECHISAIDWLFLYWTNLRIYLQYNKHSYILGYKYIKQFVRWVSR